MRKIEIKEGDRYGRLTIIKEVEPRIERSGKKRRRVLCRCDCDGKEVEVPLEHLRTGHTKSCGCWGVEKSKENGKKNKKYNKYIFNEKNGIVTGFTRKGESFIFDTEDYEKVKEYCWSIDKRGYVIATNKNKGEKNIRIHRLIMNCEDGLVVDHINHITTDNRKENLRICTQKENSRNRSMRSDNTSGVTGVVFDKTCGKWISQIYVNGKYIRLGYFKDIEKAKQSRLKAEKEYFGKFSPNYNEEKSSNG